MTQKELLQLIEKWENTEPIIYKTNIRVMCKKKNIKPKNIVEILNIPVTTAKSYTSLTNTSKISFKIALQLAELLEIDIKKLLEKE